MDWLIGDEQGDWARVAQTVQFARRRQLTHSSLVPLMEPRKLDSLRYSRPAVLRFEM